MDGRYVTSEGRGETRFAGRFASFAGLRSRTFREFHTGAYARFAHLSRRFAHVSGASYLLLTASLRTSIHPQSLLFDFCAF